MPIGTSAIRVYRNQGLIQNVMQYRTYMYIAAAARIVEEDKILAVC